jgi:predicted nuclease of predicted toxin-antitoxin system
MRFKTDENVHPDLAVYLRQHGHDAVTVWDESLRGTTDAHLAEVCKSEKRALITPDMDFADIRVYPPQHSSGIMVLRLESQSRVHVLATITRLLPMLTTHEIDGHLWIVDERGIRVRGEDQR